MQDTIQQILEQRSAAVVARDKTTLDTLFAPNFIYTNAYGVRVDKDGYMTSFVDASTIIWHSQTLSEVAVWEYGDTAIASCRVHDVATYQGEPFNAHFRSTHTLMQLDGRWQIIASHTSPIVED